MGTLGWLLALAVLLAAIHTFAARVTAAQLGAEAQRRVALLRRQQPLWQWNLQAPGDLVAGRAFGPATITADHGRLHLISLDGSPFEIGLPIQNRVDIQHWPWLRLRYQAAAVVKLQPVLATDPTAPICSGSPVMDLLPGEHEQNINLSALQWQSARATCARPTRVWMLRLRLQMAPGTSLWLRDAALLGTAVPPLSERPSAILPAQSSGLPPIGHAESNLPWFRLDVAPSAETQLAWRDKLLTAYPASFVVSAGIDPWRSPAPAAPAWWAWSAVAVYGLILLGLLYPQRDSLALAWLDIAACTVGPLWLVAGLQWGSITAWPPLLATVAALLYAIALQGLRPLSHPHGASTGWFVWLAWLPVLLTLGLLLASGHPLQRPSLAHVLTYLVWAAAQQWLMLRIVLARLNTAWPCKNPWPACLLVAVLFALLHTPNGAVMQLGLLAECSWAYCYSRSQRWWPIVLAHAACGLLIEAGLFGVLVRSLEVSARFFH